jgi:thymidine phosphorylase
VSIAAQSEDIAPADRKLYLLRDVTATVPSLPLIVASIMSKKLAVGAHRLVLDVKCGSGAFCKTPEVARRLADALMGVGQRAGVTLRTLITDMSQPLGDRLGCANEVRAAIEVLSGAGDRRLRELTVELAVEGLVLAGRTAESARAELERRLADGSALARWAEVVRAHGGDPDESRLARPSRTVLVPARHGGFVAAIDGEGLGWIAVALGAGRRRQGDRVDLSAGLRVHARVGDRIEPGQPLATLEVGDRSVEIDALVSRAAAAFRIEGDPPPKTPLILARLGGAA